VPQNPVDPTLVHLRGNRSSLVVDLAGGTPSVLHWGALLPADLDPGELRTALSPAIPQAGLDVIVPLTLLPADAAGFTGQPALAGHRDGLAWSPVFTYVTHAVTADTLTVECADPVAQLGAVVELELHPETDVLRCGVRLTNGGDAPYRLERLSLTLPLPAHTDEVLNFTGRWCKEWQEQRHRLGAAALVQENRRGRTSHDNPPGLMVGTAGFGERRGEVYGVQLGWSGNHALRVDRLATGQAYLQAGELLSPGEVTLAPGEAYDTPWLYATYSADGLAGITDSFHQFLRLRPGHPGAIKPRPVLVNTWEAVYFDHDPDRLRALADAAAAVGAERFVLDDGWFTGRNHDHAGLGDWYVDERKYPDGLTPLVEHVRKLGLEFGLWVEPEMVNPDSDLYRAHPDWALGVPGYTPLLARHQLVLDLANPDVSAYLLERLDAILSDHEISYLKWDMNRDLVQAGAGPDGRAGVHRQTLAFYELIGQLRQRHPDVEIESCSSGGARADLGVLAYTQRIWTSDCNDALERQLIQRGFSYFLPPELMGAHIGPPRSHTTARVHDLGFRATTALFGHLGIEWDLTTASPAERAVVTDVIALYKQLRPLLHGGRTVRLEPPEPAVLAHGVVAADRGAAVFAYVQLAASATTTPAPLRLTGLDPDRRYAVRWLKVGEDGLGPMKAPPPWLADGVTLTGTQLAGHGIAMPVLNPEHALLLECVAV
jgi:alpha-galactosidase